MAWKWSPTSLYFALFCSALLGCRGVIVGPSPSASQAVDGAQVGISVGASGTPAAATGLGIGTVPLRRLTSTEWERTVKDLLRIDTLPGDLLTQDDKGPSGYTEARNVSIVEGRQLMQAAEALAPLAVSNLDALTSCRALERGETACAATFIDEFGARAYRRPVVEAERAELVALYESARSAFGLDHGGALQLVIQAILQSPRFLYRWEEWGTERQAQDGLVELDGYAVASRLSYLLWGTMPDDVLLAAARAGELDSDAGVEAHARRMLLEPYARPTLTSFFSQWLEVDEALRKFKDSVLFPEADEGLRDSMVRESQAFLDHVLFQGDGRLQTLLTSRVSYVDERLATLYGMSGVVGNELRQVELDPARGGILTRAAFLSGHSLAHDTSPVQRGKVIRLRMLCQTVPPPPPDVQGMIKNESSAESTRALYEQHATDPVCAACHRLMDPIGFAFEHYDAIGRFQTMDGNAAVDSSGILVNVDGRDAPFTDAVGLLQILASSEELGRCVSRQLLRWFARRIDSPDDEPAVDSTHAALAASAGDLREMLIGLTQARAFRFRPATTSEQVLP